MIATKPASHYKCKNRCGEQAQYYAKSVPVCSFDCTYEYVIKKKAAKEKKEAIAYRAETRKMDLDTRSRTKWYKEFEKVFNAHVLLIDHDKKCFTCTTTHSKTVFHAGHYLTVGHSKATRFNLYNVHKQCLRCNNFGGGMRKEYKENIVKIYGQDVADSLEGPLASLKEQFPTTQDIDAEIKTYQAKNLELRKCLNLK